jgi:hypothetical protein
MEIATVNLSAGLDPFDLLPLVAMGLFWLLLLVRIHFKLSEIDRYLAEANADSDVRNISAAGQKRLAQRSRGQGKAGADGGSPTP